MKKLLASVAMALATLTGVAHPAMSADVQWKVELVDVPGQNAQCYAFGSAGLKFGFQVVGDKLLAGNRDKYRGFFETKIASDGSIKQEFTDPVAGRLMVTGNVPTKKVRLKNLYSGCEWDMAPKS